MVIQFEAAESPRLAGAQIARWGAAVAPQKTRSASNPAARSSKPECKFRPKKRCSEILGAKSAAAALAEQAAAVEESFVGQARGPSQRALLWIEKVVKKWLEELLQACKEASASGAKKCVWDSDECFGFSRDAEVELTQRLAEGIAIYEFVRVDWWRGCGLGWTTAPGNRIVSENLWSPQNVDHPVPVNKRRVGAWGFAVRLRVSWAAEDPQQGSIAKEGSACSACVVCQQPQRRSAKLHPCGHIFCRFCSRRLRGKPCPLCGTKCAVVQDVPLDATRTDCTTGVVEPTSAEEDTQSMILRKSDSSPDMLSKFSSLSIAPFLSPGSDVQARARVVSPPSAPQIAPSLDDGLFRTSCLPMQISSSKGARSPPPKPSQSDIETTKSVSFAPEQPPNTTSTRLATAFPTSDTSAQLAAPPNSNAKTSTPTTQSHSSKSTITSFSASSSEFLSPNSPENRTPLQITKSASDDLQPSTRNPTSGHATPSELHNLVNPAPVHQSNSAAPPRPNSIQLPSSAQSEIPTTQAPPTSPTPPADQPQVTSIATPPVSLVVSSAKSSSAPRAPASSEASPSTPSCQKDTAPKPSTTSGPAAISAIPSLPVSQDQVLSVTSVAQTPGIKSKDAPQLPPAPPPPASKPAEPALAPAPTPPTPPPLAPLAPPSLAPCATAPLAPLAPAPPPVSKPSEPVPPPAPSLATPPPLDPLAPAQLAPLAPASPPVSKPSGPVPTPASTAVTPPPLAPLAPPPLAQLAPAPFVQITPAPPPVSKPFEPAPPSAPSLTTPPPHAPLAPFPLEPPVSKTSEPVPLAAPSFVTPPPLAPLAPAPLAPPPPAPPPLLNPSEPTPSPAPTTSTSTAALAPAVGSSNSDLGSRNRRSSMASLPSGGAVLPRLQEEEEDEASGEAPPQRFQPPTLSYVPAADDDEDDGAYSAFEESGSIISPMACLTPVGNIPPVKLGMASSPSISIGRQTEAVSRERRIGIGAQAPGTGGGTPVSARSPEANKPTLLHLGIPGLRNDDDDAQSYSAFEESAIGTPMASPTAQMTLSQSLASWQQ